MARTAFSPAPAFVRYCSPRCLLSLRWQGDSLRRWRTRPFQLGQGGRWWIPPPCPLPTPDGRVASDDEAEDREEMEREMQARRRSRSHPQQQQQDSRWPSTRDRDHGTDRPRPLPPKQRAGGGELSPEDLRVRVASRGGWIGVRLYPPSRDARACGEADTAPCRPCSPCAKDWRQRRSSVVPSARGSYGWGVVCWLRWSLPSPPSPTLS